MNISSLALIRKYSETKRRFGLTSEEKWADIKWDIQAMCFMLFTEFS
jgi:hypothetical protein